MSEISSRQNAKVKLARSLHGSKGRKSSGLFLVEGLHHLGELADSDYDIEYLLLAEQTLDSPFGIELVSRFEAQGCTIHRTAPGVLDSASSRAQSNGLLAVVRQRTVSLEDLAQEEGRLHVALVRPQDPGNVGSILRTMDAVQAGALILLDGGADPFQPAAVRASLGAIFWHPLVRAGLDDFAAWAAGRNLHILGSSAHGTLDYRDLPGLERPDVLLLGSEREGLLEDQRRLCSVLAVLPMHGRGSSLNLAVAAGLLLYALKRP